MGPVGVQEMMMIFVIALLLFGPKKLPELGRTLGKALHEFRKAKDELKNTFESHLHELDREAQISSSTYKTPDYSYNQPEYKASDYNAYDGEYHSSHNVQEALPAPDPTAVDESNGHLHSTELPPGEPLVAGTVPRTNGIHPATSAVATEEKYSG